MPLPADFDIRFPSPSWITGWMKTLRNGTSPVLNCPKMTIRATQSVMMSRAVDRTLVG
jgi:hypothetical protein